MPDIVNEEKIIEEENKQIPNIIIAGGTGVGKSTLINAVFGKEIAKTGIGLPVTDGVQEYKNDFICIWDTVGLEIDNEKTTKTIQSIKDKIVEKAKQSTTDVIHAIWYCINSGSKRYQTAELELIKRLHKDNKVPFFIVLTQSYNEKESNILEEHIREINKENGLDDIDIMQVVAQDWTIEICGQSLTASQRNLDKLVDITVKKVPEYITEAFIAAQQIDKEAKRKVALEIIFKYIRESEDGFWDKMPLVRLFTGNNKIGRMQKELAKVYNTVLKNEDIEKFIIDQDLSKILWQDILNIGKGFWAYMVHQSDKAGDWIFRIFSDPKTVLEVVPGATKDIISKVITGEIRISTFSNLEYFYYDKEKQIDKIKTDIEISSNKDSELMKVTAENLNKKYNKVAILIFTIGINFVIVLEEYWDKIVKSKVEDLGNIVEEMSKSFKDRIKGYMASK